MPEQPRYEPRLYFKMKVTPSTKKMSGAEPSIRYEQVRRGLLPKQKDDVPIIPHTEMRHIASAEMASKQ